MLKNIISKLEAAGFILEYSLDTINIKSRNDTINGEIYANTPEESWMDSSAIRVKVMGMNPKTYKVN